VNCEVENPPSSCDNIITSWRNKLGLDDTATDFGDHTQEVEKEMIALYTEYKTVIEETTALYSEWEETLKVEQDLELHQIEFADLPNMLYPNQLLQLKPIIKDWNEVVENLDKITISPIRGDVLQSSQTFQNSNIK
jgi:hypothetical protein